MKRLVVWAIVSSVVVAGIAVITVFPTRTYLGQRDDLAAAEARLDVLSKQNRDLAARAERLNSDAEIERLAREQYNLVKPGEEAYAILPPAETADPPAPAKSFKAKPVEPEPKSKSLLDRLVFWD